ncbi:PREDICTED: uncharacterized protein LOC108362782 [Rhagoletis zephyria]|uniref:uncharacterized protein LOC108362782 n=1 Tax=Rhagoletis zephyria TaxID=28612 RepID=UPI0008114DAB|nr:PREDICTED: uncharacterized protein LOC108362782 [Rhagoletis zephyria]
MTRNTTVGVDDATSAEPQQQQQLETTAYVEQHTGYRDDATGDNTAAAIATTAQSQHQLRRNPQSSNMAATEADSESTKTAKTPTRHRSRRLTDLVLDPSCNRLACEQSVEQRDALTAEDYDDAVVADEDEDDDFEDGVDGENDYYDESPVQRSARFLQPRKQQQRKSELQEEAANTAKCGGKRPKRRIKTTREYTLYLKTQTQYIKAKTKF